jgi:hypothetical protein
VIECGPWVSEEVVKEATPFVSAIVPSSVTPSRNFTFPVADAGVTVAVRITAAPTVAGFGVAINATDDAAWTVSVTTAEEADVSFESPA